MTIIEYDRFEARALELGAFQAKLVAPEAIVVEHRVTLKCRFGCPHHGTSYSCPPRVPGVAEFREALHEYGRVLVVAFPAPAAPAGDEARGLQRARHDDAMPPAVKERVERFYREWDRSKLAAFDGLLELERAAFNGGEPLALALRPGRCNLCPECPAEGPCRHPTRLRFSPEAVGVNLSATCRQAGLDLVFPFGDKPSHIGMVLLG